MIFRVFWGYNVVMICCIKKFGNSMLLVIFKDMWDYLGLVSDEVEVFFEKGCFVLCVLNLDVVVDDVVWEIFVKYD